MLKNWLHIFIYNIKNNKLFTLLNTLGLSIGIAGVIFAILYWNDENSYDKWNPEVNNVYQVVTNLQKGVVWPYSIAPLEPYLKEMSEIDNYFYTRVWYGSDIAEANGQKKYLKKILSAQKDIFNLFPFKFIKGSSKSALDDKMSVVLSKKIADYFFKGEEPIGKNIKYGNRNYTVTGVFEIPGKSSIAPEMITTRNITNLLKEGRNSWGDFNYSLLLNIKNPKNLEKVAKKIEEIYYKNRTEKFAKEEGISVEDYIKKHGKISISLDSLKDARLKSKHGRHPEGKGNYQFLLIMVGLSVLILILSIVNYINLATAGAIKRGKEVGVRKVVGASKLNIVYQFIFETIITTLFAILLALAIVELTLPYYNNILDKELSLHSGQFYLQIILILIVVIILAGIFPAFYIANFKSLKVLKGNFDRSKSGVWLRNGMLILQFAVASFFIIGSYIVYKQVKHLTTKDLGFSGEQVLEITYRKTEKEPEGIIKEYETVKDELLKMNGVINVAGSAFRMGGGAFSSSGFMYKENSIQAQNMATDFDFIDIFNIKMKEGRKLQAKFASDSIKNILINETAQRMMQEKNPIEKEIKWNGRDLKIIGVVKDFDILGPHKETLPMVFFHLKTIDWMAYNMNLIYVKVSPDNIEQTISNIETFWQAKVDQKYPFEFEFTDKAFAETYKDYVNQKNLFSILNIIVILIALFGLFALASFSIQRKMKSIAIKKTLGAETKTLLLQLSKQYVVFCVIGFLLAIYPVVYFLNKWLENFAYRINLTVIPFLIGFLVLLFLTLVIVLGKAYQATKVDVLKYLKYE